MINKVLLFGTVGDRVSDKATSTGKRMLSFSIKQINEYTDRSTNENKSSTAYYNIVMFNESAKINPGDNVLIEGKLGNSKDKNDKYVLGVTAQKVTVIHDNPGQKDMPITLEYKEQDMPF